MNTLTLTPGGIDRAVELIVDSAMECADQMRLDWRHYLYTAETQLRGFLLLLRQAEGPGGLHAHMAIMAGIERINAHRQVCINRENLLPSTVPRSFQQAAGA